LRRGLILRPPPPVHDSEIPRELKSGLDYSNLCSHNSKETQKEETEKYYKNLAGAERKLKSLPEKFKKIHEGLFE